MIEYCYELVVIEDKFLGRGQQELKNWGKISITFKIGIFLCCRCEKVINLFVDHRVTDEDITDIVNILNNY